MYFPIARARLEFLPNVKVRTLSDGHNGMVVRDPSFYRAQELCESRGGRSGLLVLNSLYGLCGRKTTLSQVDIL